MNTLSFPQITVSYKDADASKRVRIHSSKESYDILKTFYEWKIHSYLPPSVHFKVIP